MDELKWIELLKRTVTKGRNVVVGIGDDCALVKIGKEKALLKSDVFVEGVHFTRGKTPYKTIGWRAVSRVFSDFAACAGLPKFIGVSAGVPNYVKEKDLRQILLGIVSCCKKFHCSLVAGDTSRASKLFLDVWGIAQAEKCVLRNTAKEDDYIFISGRLGRRDFSETFLPRIKEAQYLVKHHKVNAMIDISDGFVLDLYRILKESNKGALVYEKDIPVNKGISDFYRGEDYELLFTVDKSDRGTEVLKKKFYLVGRVKNANFGYKIARGSRIYPVKVRGYTHS